MDANKRNTENKEKMRGPEEEGEGERKKGEGRGVEIFIPMLQELRCPIVLEMNSFNWFINLEFINDYFANRIEIVNHSI